MKFAFELRARAVTDESIPQKHDPFVGELTKLAAPWGLDKNSLPTAPDPGAQLSAHFNLGKCLGKGIRGHAYYQFRRPFRDEGCEDDFVDLTFNPAKFDFRTLAYEVFPVYVTAFGAYVAEIAHDEFSYVDYEILRELRLDFRFGVYRVNHVCFFDEILCKRAFKLTPGEVMNRLKGAVEETRLLGDGVHIIGSSTPLSFEEADKLSRDWRMRLQ